MKLRSRGLGRRELLMDFREYDIGRDGDDVVITGTIREPVNWDFTIRFSGDDIPGMLRVALHRHTLSVAARWMLHLRSKTPAGAEIPAAAPVPIARPARALRPVPAEDEKVGAPKPSPITRLRPPAPDGQPLSPVVRTPDFGAPRRRGSAQMTAAAPVAGAAAEGGRR